jgi:hypothetical protein
MSGADGTSAGLSGSGLQGLLSKFTGGSGGQASQFSADGSAPSQFTMPGGGPAQYQGTSMLPATLGGVQGVADAQNFTQQLQDASGMSAANIQQMLQGLGTAGQLQAPQTQQQTPRAPAGARAGGGQQPNFVPQQLTGLPGAPTQGTVNLQNPVNATVGPTQAVQNLMQLLKLGNTGFTI